MSKLILERLGKSPRSIYLDIVKGFAIILVVYGHCLPYYSDEYMRGDFFYSDELYKIIYSFHMPLFMLVSGYLFYGSIVRHSWTNNLKFRFSKLLLPVVFWNTLYLCISNTIILLNIIAKLGQKSLGIYVISVSLINAFILPNLTSDVEMNYMIVGLISIGVLVVSYILTLCLEKFSLTRKLFLGGR